MVFPIVIRRQDGTQEVLKEHIRSGNAVRVGATVDPNRRLGQYQREGYSGTIIFAETQNMKKAENGLLEECKTCSLNIQHSSNVGEKPGHVYVIIK